METACNYFFDALRAPAPGGLLKLQAADRSRDDPFSLSEVLSFLPDRQHAELAELITTALHPCVQNFSSAAPQVNKNHEAIVEITSHIVWLLLQDRKRPPVSEIRALIILFHSFVMKLPTRRAQNHIALMCEWLWAVNDPERRSIIPYTLLYLILRSFDDKSFFVNGAADTDVAGTSNGLPTAHRRSTCVGFVRRLYAMRRALWDLDLSVDGQSRTFRTMLLRCATSHTFMADGEGRKFIAYVLTLEDVRDEMLDAMVNQLSVIRTTRSPLIGNVLLHAWMKYRSDWLADRLIRVAEQAILAKRDPFATNLRMVLASFHLNKKLGAGIDVLLHHIYTPILYGNLFVANPIVRRNAVNIMADAFPIYDPGSPKEEIDAALQMQSTKLLELLTDDAPIVRQSAVTGSCRVLGMLWEILPSLTTRKMIDVITTKLSADMSSAPVRIAVFNGLRFLVDNHLIHNVLKVVLPPLGRFIRDPVEKVRLGGLDLLLKVKSKRLKGLRYFDIVPVDKLIAMLTTEPEYIALKVMKLIVSSHFPTEQPDWTPEQLAAVRVKACLSMLDKNPDAARFFYSHINMFVPPRPLCEFALRLSSLALEADSAPSRRTKTQARSTKAKTKAKTKTKGTESKGKTKGAPQSGVQTRRRGRSAAAQVVQQEEVAADDIEPVIEDVSDKENENKEADGTGADDDEVKTLGLENVSEEYVEGRKDLLLTIVADILQSIRPSLYKEKNKSLREYLDEIYRGTVLKPHLIARGNPIAARAACWRTASCVSVSHIAPLVVLWREQMDSVVNWPRQTDEDVQGYRQLLAALVLCGIRWGIIPSILAVVAGWADGAASGRRSAFVGSKRANSSKTSAKASAKSKGKGKSKSTSGGSGVSTRRTRTSARRAAAGTAKNEPDVKEEDDHQENEANDNNTAANAEILGEGRIDSLYALHALGSILTDPNDEVSGELHAAIATAPSTTNEQEDFKDEVEIEDGSTKYGQVQSSPGRVITHMRKGVLGALDHLFEQLPNGSTLSKVPDFPLLLRVLSTVLKASVGLALRREASSTEGELFDVREIIQWLSGPHLWANAARVHGMFAVVICAVCAGPLADVAALQKFNAADARILKAVFAKAGELMCDVRIGAGAGAGGAGAADPIGRFVVEGLRLALHVDLHSDALAEEGSDVDVKTTEFRESACAIVRYSLRAMRGVRFADGDGEEQEAGDLFSLKQTQVLMMRALSHIASVGHAKDYSRAMADELTLHFSAGDEQEEDGDDGDDDNNNPDAVYERVRRSYVGVTLCEGIRAMVTGSLSWAKDHDASLVFKLVWDALTDTDNESNGAALTFVKLVRKRCLQFYDHELAQRTEHIERDEDNEEHGNNAARDEVVEQRRQKLGPFFEYVKELVGRGSIEDDDADIDLNTISGSLD